MELTEPIESINQQLIDLFGIDTITGDPIFRVVWAADQFEKRYSKFTRDGIELLYPDLMTLPKYPQNDEDYKEKFILERLVLVPDVNKDELPVNTSYEPLWIFRDKYNNYLPPTLWAAKFCIDTVYAAQGKKSLAKYKDEGNTVEAKVKRIKQIEEELFGSESDLKLRTVTGEAVAYTGESKLSEN